MKRFFPYFFIFPFSLLAFSGCNSYRIVDTHRFMNEDGAVAVVGYGRAEKDHVNTFRSPANGQELEFTSKLVVEVELPDGESFTAWQGMNFAGAGTLYRSDDDEWIVLVAGFICRVAPRDENVPQGYREVFSGVLCNTPVEKPEQDTRWRKVPLQSVRSKQ